MMWNLGHQVIIALEEEEAEEEVEEEAQVALGLRGTVEALTDLVFHLWQVAAWGMRTLHHHM